MSAGKHGHVLAIDEDGNLWTWEKNNYGQCGYGSNIYSIRTPLML